MNRYILYLCFAGCFCISNEMFAQYTAEFRFSTTEVNIPQVRLQKNDQESSVKFNVREKCVFRNLSPGLYSLLILGDAHDTILAKREIEISRDSVFYISVPEIIHGLSEVLIIDAGSVLGRDHLRSVEGMAVYAGKRSEVVYLKNMTANTANNNARQIYNKVSGLNIWESDAGGLQLGIGGRGLSPGRTSNFNTRQNGYDISADALGYPESYYSPAPEFMDRIEVIRGAASLQYGSQFGGLVNFRLRQGDPNRKLGTTTRFSGGSFGMLGVFNSVSGTVGRMDYYGGHLYRQASGWRKNSGYKLNEIYTNVGFRITEKITLRGEYTFMNSLAQQPGGLTDAQFKANPQQSVRDRNWFRVQWNLFAFTTDWKLGRKTKWQNRFFGLQSMRESLGYLGSINRPDPMTERTLIHGDFANMGWESRLMHYYRMGGNNAVLLTGFRLYKGKTTMQQGGADNGSGPDFRFLDNNDIDESDYVFPGRNAAFFAENVFFLGKKHRWSITPGLRAEWIDTRTDGYFYIRNEDLAGNIIYEAKSYRQSRRERTIFLSGLGISFKPCSAVEIIGNISQNYRAINFSDVAVVNPNFQVDPKIKDESGFTVDIGMRGQVGAAFTYDVSGFWLQYNNRIGEVLTVDTFSYNVVRYRTNIGQSQNTGIETFLECDLIRLFSDSSRHAFSVFSNATWIHAVYNKSDIPGVEGKKVELVPEWMIRCGAEYRYKTFRLSFSYAWLDEQYADATNAASTPTAIFGLIPAYGVMDISTSFQWRRWKLEGSVNNLANNYYYTRRATSYPGPGIIPSDGRGYYLTLQFTF